MKNKNWLWGGAMVLLILNFVITHPAKAEDGQNQPPGPMQNFDRPELNRFHQDLGGFEKNLAGFENKLKRLQTQGVGVPSEVSDNLEKIKNLLSSAKQTNSLDQLQSGDFSNLPELMNNLNDNQTQLNQLARWPQTFKQANRQLKNLNRALNRAKKLTAKLATQGVDVSTTYQKFSDDVAALQTTLNETNDKIKAGDQTAYDTLASNFFGKLDDLQTEQETFDTLANLSRFNANFKKEMANTQKTIARLAAQGEDTTDLNSQLDDINQKGADLNTALQTKPLDIETIASDLEDLGQMKHDLRQAINDLMPAPEFKPWEQGKNEFGDLKLPNTFNNIMPAPTATTSTVQP